MASGGGTTNPLRTFKSLQRLLIRLTGSPRAERVKSQIEAGDAGPFDLSRDEACWLSCQLLDVPSETLAPMLGVPARTIRHWRSAHLETARARRNEEIARLYGEGVPVKRIARKFGLSERWVYEIIRAERRGEKLARRRLF